MTLVKVQCKGSGKVSGASVNAKRAACPSCGRLQDVTGTGKIRKHMRLTSKRRLKTLR